jgi:hypothetical protein
MIKRISCRVVGSVPLGKNSSRERHISASDNKGRQSCRTVAAKGCCPSNSAVRASQLFTIRESVNDGLVGLILDCYV